VTFDKEVVALSLSEIDTLSLSLPLSVTFGTFVTLGVIMITLQVILVAEIYCIVGLLNGRIKGDLAHVLDK